MNFFDCYLYKYSPFFRQSFNTGDIGNTLTSGERQRIFILENEDGSIFRFETEINSTPRWSSRFKHGAEMYIGLYDGITFFLGNRIQNKKKLTSIQKIKFKNTTHGNVIYSIFTSEKKHLEAKSNVFGSFMDNEGNTYYYYGHDIRNNRKTSDDIIMDTYHEEMIGLHHLKLNAFKVAQTQVFSLYDIIGSLDSKFKEQIANQTEITHSLILDVVNKLCLRSDGVKGVVAGYEDIHYSSSGDYGDILNGNCKIEITKTNEFKSHSGEYYYRDFKFCVIDNLKKELFSGSVRFAQPLV